MKQIYSILIVFSLVACTDSKTNEENQYEYIESNCANLPDIPFELDSIINGMQAKLNDSLWSNYWMPEHNRIIDELDAFKDGTKELFPYSDFDSVVFVFYKPYTDLENANDLEKRTIKDISVLCQEKANLLLNVINDPMNYTTGECGTAIPFSQVVFYFRNKKVGELTFACSYSSIRSVPENTMIFGNLNSRGDSLLNLVKPWN